MKKYTNGPWKFAVADAVKSENGIKYYEVYGANNSVVARRVIGDCDALLIATAPELLEAAKAMQKHILDKGWSTAFEFETLNKLSAAIAKAEGTNE